MDYNNNGGAPQGYPQYPQGSPMGSYIGFTDAIRICLNKYCCFQGRATRAEYWWWILFSWIVSALISLIFGTHTLGMIINGIVGLALLLPTLGVSWRRMHDIGKGGGWYFINLIPLVGLIIWIVYCCKPSEPMPNRFGDVPA